MTLSGIRKILDSLPLLSFDDFAQTDGQDLTRENPKYLTPMDDWGYEELTDALSILQTNYLHYLCMMGRSQPIRDFIRKMKGEYYLYGETIDFMLNDHSMYHHWDGTPLHTLVSWNNSPELALYLVNQGSDPTIQNYYKEIPGEDVEDSWYISPFQLGCEIDHYGNEPEKKKCVSREIQDFREVRAYLKELVPNTVTKTDPDMDIPAYIREIPETLSNKGLTAFLNAVPEADPEPDPEADPNCYEFNLTMIREQIDSTPLVTYDEFRKTDRDNLMFASAAPLAHRTPARVMDDQVDYLHYLCMLGRFVPIRDYLDELKRQYGDITGILNDHGIYHHWFQTPLSTLASWNNNMKLVRYLVNHGADPEICDYYGSPPGYELEGTIYISPFKLGIPLDKWGVNSPRYRNATDFTEVYDYLEGLRKADDDIPEPPRLILSDIS